ncbi:hypothetical protein D9619_007931 [Psilocybe cf. subviscida]|uniref:C2H2-type domain-containing protein n=1 Tax=Psilocybe cf. subviscida TaxID=2480587 RepID=A0A8H5ESE1_9AGAR|nr:hypothetical protein D9619_007931 [Psilocybe cf. subviscida]
MPRAQKGTGQHPCPLCDKWFTRPGDVQRHIVGMHSHERYPHVCGFSASQKSNRKAHYKAYPECAKAAELLELAQEDAPVRSSNPIYSPTLPPAVIATVTAKKPRTRTRGGARQSAAPYSTSARRGPLPSEASTSASPETEQASPDASLSYPVQLYLPQCQLPQTFYPQQEGLDALSYYQEPQPDLSFQSTASQQWQDDSFPTYSNEQHLQDSYLKEFLSLPSPVDFIPPVFDDPALQNILTATYATGNISDLPGMHATQLNAILANHLDFMASPDDHWQADWDPERLVRENPPSPSVLDSLPSIDDHMYSILAMADPQSFNSFASFVS